MQTFTYFTADFMEGGIEKMLKKGLIIKIHVLYITGS